MLFVIAVRFTGLSNDVHTSYLELQYSYNVKDSVFNDLFFNLYPLTVRSTPCKLLLSGYYKVGIHLGTTEYCCIFAA